MASAQPQAVAAALAALAAANPRELHHRRADGSRVLDSLYETCRAAGLCPAVRTPGTAGQQASTSATAFGARASPEEERYFAVFDAVLQNGLGCWVQDYVELVCADRYLASNDPLEAWLLDGEFVKAWCTSCLQRAEQALVAALTTSQSFVQFATGQLQQALAQAHVLVAVLQALDRIRSAGAAGSSGRPGSVGSAQDRLSVKPQLSQATLLQQCLQVMQWCVRRGLHLQQQATPTGRHSSYPEWTRAVQARRARAAPRTLFLDTMLQSLAISGAYPSASLHNMLHTLLLVVRRTEPAAWRSKLALLTYYLLDTGALEVQAQHQHAGAYGPHTSNGGTAPGTSGGGAGRASAGAGATGGSSGLEAALEELRAAFRLAASDVCLWRCLYLMDCAAPGGPGPDPSLDQACALLPACVTPDTPFTVIEALLACGRPEVALAVDRGLAGATGGGSSSSLALDAPAAAAAAAASEGVATEGSLARAVLRMDIRLRCGLMTEAFMVMRDHCAAEAAGQEARAQHAAALLTHLARWAADHSSTRSPWLQRLVELPMSTAEEAVLVGWLLEELDAGRAAGDLLPLYYLQRGRASEALAAWTRWDARHQALVAAGQARASEPAVDLLASALMAAHGALPLPLRNVAVPAADPLTGQEAIGGTAGILPGLMTQSSPDVPLAELRAHGPQRPLLITSAICADQGACVASSADDVPADPAAATQPDHLQQSLQAQAFAPASAAAASGGLFMQDAGGAPAFSALTLPAGGAPFAVPRSPYPGPMAAPRTGYGSSGGSAMGGGGAPLFSIGAAAAPVGAGAGAWPGSGVELRGLKRPKPNTWLQ